MSLEILGFIWLHYYFFLTSLQNITPWKTLRDQKLHALLPLCLQGFFPDPLLLKAVPALGFCSAPFYLLLGLVA